MLIDTHCHLDFDQFEGDRQQVVARAAEAGVKRIIVPAIGLESGRRIIRLAERTNSVFAAVGVHPNSSADWRPSHIDLLRELATHHKVVAIGEIGLDYYRDRSPRLVQQQALTAQLELAIELNLPVIIHNRDSDADLLDILANASLGAHRPPGVLHSFSGAWQTAKSALEMGYYLGFTGPVTFKKADDLRAVVSRVPLDRILVETDAPFLAPQQYRGRRNEPAYVVYVADRIAAIHEVPADELARRTTENAINVFGEKLASQV